MEDALIFDTTFLVDFQREARRGDTAGPAHRFLEAHGDATMAVPFAVVGEFAEGFDHKQHAALYAAIARFEVLPGDTETALRYGALTRSLRAAGRLIGTNDLWIAACALRHSRALVTRNADEFSRVPGLRVVRY